MYCNWRLLVVMPLISSGHSLSLPHSFFYSFRLFSLLDEERKKKMDCTRAQQSENPYTYMRMNVESMNHGCKTGLAICYLVSTNYGSHGPKGGKTTQSSFELAKQNTARPHHRGQHGLCMCPHAPVLSESGLTGPSRCLESLSRHILHLVMRLWDYS